MIAPHAVYQKRIDQNDFCMGFILYFAQKRFVIGAELFVACRIVAVVTAPCIVYADEYCDDIGVYFREITLCTFKQVFCAVAADAEVYEFDILFRQSGADKLRCIFDIARAKLVAVGIIPAGIGHAVALKQYPHSFIPFRNVLLIQNNLSSLHVERRKAFVLP